MGRIQGTEEALVELAVRRLRVKQPREIERAIDAAKGLKHRAGRVVSAAVVPDAGSQKESGSPSRRGAVIRR